MIPAIALALLPGCGRLAEIGQAPQISAIGNPALQTEARTISMPMPAPTILEREPSSLWRTGARSFFRDQRAKTVGDILTVLIDIEDRAQLQNQTQRRRANSESAGLPAFFGFEQQLSDVLPDEVDPDSLVELESGSDSTGTGSVNRTERITMRVAAVVTDVLPNGNLVIAGRQEVRVNFELRELRVAGVIRPEDITNTNAIDYDKIAEARVSYGGRGHISDVQQPRYGQQIFDIIMPW
ncbi:flagellar basal body L-ring protein FlgH [Arenibaculum sp.]|uniref:flagellar basal body L-ring protein FlgH n=1 Tax=Arenibaculum sp. TaxID=2865862 RepID=UPI002E0E9EAB|nr:flagellar basal body L-ring protein FlgH [Arenibaculum sp.]